MGLRRPAREVSSRESNRGRAELPHLLLPVGWRFRCREEFVSSFPRFPLSLLRVLSCGGVHLFLLIPSRLVHLPEMWKLTSSKDYRYTNQSSLVDLPGVDDAEDYARVRVGTSPLYVTPSDPPCGNFYTLRNSRR